MKKIKLYYVVIVMLLLVDCYIILNPLREIYFTGSVILKILPTRKFICWLVLSRNSGVTEQHNFV